MGSHVFMRRVRVMVQSLILLWYNRLRFDFCGDFCEFVGTGCVFRLRFAVRF